MEERVEFGLVGIGERVQKGAPAEGRLLHKCGRWESAWGIAHCSVWLEHEVTGCK